MFSQDDVRMMRLHYKKLHMASKIKPLGNFIYWGNFMYLFFRRITQSLLKDK